MSDEIGPTMVELLEAVQGYGLYEREDAGSTREPMSEAAAARYAHFAKLLKARLDADADVREAEERASVELKSIVQRLDAAGVDSGGASERVGYALQGMQRGWSTADELQARLDTVRADRATIKSALDRLKDTVIVPLIKTLGVQHNEEILPAVQVLRIWPTLLEQIEARRAFAVDRQRSRDALTELRIMIQLSRTSVFREAVLALLELIERGL